jgi:hypothetical protein
MPTLTGSFHWPPIYYFHTPPPNNALITQLILTGYSGHQALEHLFTVLRGRDYSVR